MIEDPVEVYVVIVGDNADGPYVFSDYWDAINFSSTYALGDYSFHTEVIICGAVAKELIEERLGSR